MFGLHRVRPAFPRALTTAALALLMGAGLMATPVLSAEPGWAEFAGRLAAGPQSMLATGCGVDSGTAAEVESTTMRLQPINAQGSKSACVLAADFQSGLLPSSEYKLAALAPSAAREVLPPDLRPYIEEDAQPASVAQPYRYGVVVNVADLGYAEGRAQGGLLERLPDGRLLWRAELHSPGARTMEVAFATLRLTPGAEVFVRSADSSVSRGPLRAGDALPDERYFSAFVPGDRLIIELAMTPAAAATTKVQVASLVHGYRDIFGRDRSTKSGSCNVDTACPLGNSWRDQIDSVGHYTFQKDGSSAVCSGQLIANAAGDTTPNFLTANHCISSAAVASTVVVYWNFQSPTCRTPGSTASGTPLSNSIATHTQSGAQMLATYAPSDFTLLRLNAAVPAASGPYWSGWDRSGGVPTYGVSIHHPAGDEKRISDTIQPLALAAYLEPPNSGSTHLRVASWTNGTTEGGSSGSGLWDQNRRLVGQLHGGFAACGNSLSDYYGRLSVSWNGGGTAATRLSSWLDPTGSGLTLRDGYRATGGGGGGSGPQNEPSVSGVTLPAPNPPNASCPAGYFIATVTDGPGTGITSGSFGMELLLDDPGTRILQGGLNFGGLIDRGQVGFAGINFTNAANENQRLNLSLRGSPSGNANGIMPVRVTIIRQTSATASETVFVATADLRMDQFATASIILPPAYYVATVAFEGAGGAIGGAPEGQFFFELTTSFVDRPGGGFQGGAVVGGYHALHPFGGVSGFAAFCISTPHSASVRVLSAPSYGPAGAGDLRLRILNAQQQPIIAVPTD